MCDQEFVLTPLKPRFKSQSRIWIKQNSLICWINDSGDGFGSRGFDDSVLMFISMKGFSNNMAMDSCCFRIIIPNISMRNTISSSDLWFLLSSIKIPSRHWCKDRNYYPQIEFYSLSYSQTNSKDNTNSDIKGQKIGVNVVIVKAKYLLLKCAIFHAFTSCILYDTKLGRLLHWWDWISSRSLINTSVLFHAGPVSTSPCFWFHSISYRMLWVKLLENTFPRRWWD